MSVRRQALEALTDIIEDGAYANLRLKQMQQGMARQDAAFASALVYTTLEHLYYIDYVLAAFVQKRQKRDIRSILRIGVCQILFMSTPHAVACNECTALAKEIGKGAMSGFINAVLRNVCRNVESLPALPETAAERMSITYSCPLWLVNEYIGDYGEEWTESLLKARIDATTIRAQLPFTTDELKKELSARGQEYSCGAYESNALKINISGDISADELFKSGKITVQSESAMLTCRACGVEPDMTVLDACAAPGGKTAYLSMMLGKGNIIAWDVHPHRVELMKNTFKRLNIVNVKAETQDATVPVEALYGKMDVVLVDAPCSGLGLPGKPDVRLAKTSEDIDALCAIQRKLLEVCAKYVKSGGALVYSTCTISKRENQNVAMAFLNEHHEFEAGGLDVLLPAMDKERTKNGMLQLYPHIDGTEGFFIARMLKR